MLFIEILHEFSKSTQIQNEEEEDKNENAINHYQNHTHLDRFP